jgi:hypothetical protein
MLEAELDWTMARLCSPTFFFEDTKNHNMADEKRRKIFWLGKHEKWWLDGETVEMAQRVKADGARKKDTSSV